MTPWRRKRDLRFYVTLPGGRQISLRTRDKRVAERRARALELGQDPFADEREAKAAREAQALAAVEPQAHPLWRDRDAYLHACEHGTTTRRVLRPTTLSTDRGTIHRFFDFLAQRGRESLSESHPRDVADWLDSLDCAPGTYNRKRAVLSALFRWASRTGRWNDERGDERPNPARLALTRNATHYDSHRPERVRMFPDELVAEIIDQLEARAILAPPEPLLPAVYVALYTGSRAGEIARLRCEDFDWQRGVLDAEMAKRKKRKICEIHPALEERWRAEWEGREGYVVPRLEAWRQQSADDVASRLSERFTAFMKDIGKYQRGLTLHAFRHTFVSNALQAGVPLGTIALWLQTNQATLEKHYAHLLPRATGAAAAELRVRWWRRDR